MEEKTKAEPQRWTVPVWYTADPLTYADVEARHPEDLVGVLDTTLAPHRILLSTLQDLYEAHGPDGWGEHVELFTPMDHPDTVLFVLLRSYDTITSRVATALRKWVERERVRGPEVLVVQLLTQALAQIHGPAEHDAALMSAFANVSRALELMGADTDESLGEVMIADWTKHPDPRKQAIHYRVMGSLWCGRPDDAIRYIQEGYGGEPDDGAPEAAGEMSYASDTSERAAREIEPAPATTTTGTDPLTAEDRRFGAEVDALREKIHAAESLLEDVRCIRKAWASEPAGDASGEWDIFIRTLEAEAAVHVESTAGNDDYDDAEPIYRAGILAGIAFLNAICGYDTIPEAVTPVVQEIVARRGIVDALAGQGAAAPDPGRYVGSGT